MQRFLICTLLVAETLLCSDCRAQQPRPPAAGTQLPSVAAFDENGQPFSTDQLRGNYTVLVFGCLT